MTDPAAWVVLIMVVRWIYWSVLWWYGALRRAGQVVIQPDGVLVLRIDLAGVPGWPGGMQPDGSQ